MPVPLGHRRELSFCTVSRRKPLCWSKAGREAQGFSEFLRNQGERIEKRLVLIECLQ